MSKTQFKLIHTAIFLVIHGSLVYFTEKHFNIMDNTSVFYWRLLNAFFFCSGIFLIDYGFKLKTKNLSWRLDLYKEMIEYYRNSDYPIQVGPTEYVITYCRFNGRIMPFKITDMVPELRFLIEMEHKGVIKKYSSQRSDNGIIIVLLMKAIIDIEDAGVTSATQEICEKQKMDLEKDPS